MQKTFIVAISWVLTLSQAFATGAEQAAHALREDLEIREGREPRYYFSPNEVVMLPEGEDALNQGGSELCWVYAFLSGVETRVRINHPGTKALFSRSALQWLTRRDRVLRAVEKQEVYLSERGSEVDAFKLVQEYGLWAFEDLPELFKGGTSYEDTYERVLAVEPARRHEVLDWELGHIYRIPSLPAQTRWQGALQTPLQMAKWALGQDQWRAFGISPNERSYWDDHPDPDARRETQAYLVPKDLISGLIHRSLKAGYPLTFLAGGHVTLIYGAEYGPNGRATVYHFKDSFYPYRYEADAERTERRMQEVATAYPGK